MTHDPFEQAAPALVESAETLPSSAGEANAVTVTVAAVCCAKWAVAVS
jgi:hypothetical protein